MHCARPIASDRSLNELYSMGCTKLLVVFIGLFLKSGDWIVMPLSLKVFSDLQQKPPVDPDVADVVPSAPTLTAYDQEHLVTYLRLLDAEAEGDD